MVVRPTVNCIKLNVTLLEQRNVASAVWPVSRPTYVGYDLSQTYGQLERTYNSIYSDLRFHSGIDIVVASGTQVTAIADGKVYNEPLVSPGEHGYLGRITITNSHLQDPTQQGWTYLHIRPLVNPGAAPDVRIYRKDDVVGPTNRQIAEVHHFSGTFFPSHLPLERGGGDDPYAKGYWLRPTKDPLDFLAAGNDTKAPVVVQALFKSGENNAGGDSWGAKSAANG